MAKNSFVTVQVKSKKYKLITTDLKRVYRIEKPHYPSIPSYNKDKELSFPETE